jgi:hypothetical protein
MCVGECAGNGTSHEIGGEGLESRGDVRVESNVTFEGEKCVFTA